MTTRFMIIRKSDKSTEAGVTPSEELRAAMKRHGDELQRAGAIQPGVAMKPTSKGKKVMFSGGKATVIDGPFPDAKGAVAGLTLIDVPSKEAALDWVKRWPALDGDGEVEVEVREAGCPGGVKGVQPESSSGGPAPNPTSAGADTKRFAVILKTTEHTEAGYVAGEEVLAAMTRRNEEAARAGVLLAGEGLKPSSKGARVKFSKGRPAVMDGPFAEAKELVAGYWLIQVRSMDEAIEWVKRYPYPLGPDGEGEVEIREVFEEPGLLG